MLLLLRRKGRWLLGLLTAVVHVLEVVTVSSGVSVGGVKSVEVNVGRGC
jgi:hypothetical protein